MTVSVADVIQPVPAAGPRRLSAFGLQGRTALVALVVSLAIGAVAMTSLVLVAGAIAERLGTAFAIRNVLWHKERLHGAIARELALSQKMADDAVIKAWVHHEDDPATRALALAQLEGYRRVLHEHTWFLAFEPVRHLYYNDAADKYAGKELAYTLEDKPGAADWYFTSMRSPQPFNLNMDKNNALGVTKLWLNVAIEENGQRLGVVGTGIDLSTVITEFINTGEAGMSAILLDRGGAIEAHQDTGYVDFNTLSKTAEQRVTIDRLLADDGERRAVHAALDSLAAGQREAATLWVHLNGRRSLAAAAFIPELGWYTFTLYDLNQVVGVGDFAPLAVVLGAALLAVIVLLVLLVDRMVLRPLVALTQSARRIADGDYQVALASARGDEIGQLTRAFGDMARTVQDHTATLEQKVRDRTEALHESNRKVVDSIRYARSIQSAILPAPSAIDARLAGHFVLWKPRDVVGGDFYFFRDRGPHCLLAVADCTGHGVPGAFMSMSAHAVLEQAVDQLGDGPPAAVLAAVNRNLRSILHQEGLEDGDGAQDNGLDLGLVRCDPAGGRLAFAGGRINLVVADAGGVQVIKGDSVSLGYRRARRPPDFTSHDLAAPPGRTFYLASDGLLDQAGGARGLPFGTRRFLALVAEHHARPLAEQAQTFEQALAEYQGEHRQRDDITLLGFRMAG